MSAIKAGSLSRRDARRVVYLLLDTYERAMAEVEKQTRGESDEAGGGKGGGGGGA